MPRPRPQEVLVQVHAAGICGTDLHILAGEYPCRPPVTLGHELAGTICEVGSDVTGWAVGDQVTSLPFAVLCGDCEFCRGGQPALCPARLSYGSGVNGAMAEYVTLNASGLYRLPGNPDFIAGALTEPFACVCKAVFEVGRLERGERVVILGPGPIGLLTLLAARSAGAEVSIIGRESDRARLELAKRLGAVEIFYAHELDTADKLQDHFDGRAPDVVMECSGAGAAFRMGLELVRKRGRIIQVGLYGGDIQVDLNRVVFKDVALRGSFSSSYASWERALDLIRSGQLDLRPLVSNVYALADWETAFAGAVAGTGLKVVFEPGRGGLSGLFDLGN